MTEKKIPEWGKNGVRYDECCEHCGKETDVDNFTGYCRKCYHWYPWITRDSN